MVNHGYDTGGVDGVAGDGTYSAVLAFQTDNGIDADGIVGSGTWNLLKTLYRVPVEGLGIDKLVNVAKHEADLSFKEDNSNNITPYGQWYGMNGEPWCAMFVSWCAYQAGLLETTIPSFAYCPYGVNEYIAKDRYYSAASRYIPRVGDVVFFIDSTDDTASHTGIIVEVSETGIKTVEGNTQDEVGYRNYEFGDPYILGYGCNEHAEFTDPPEPTEFEKNNAVARKAGTILERLGFENIVSASNIILAIGGSIPISPTKTAHSFYMGDNVILTVAFKRGIDIHTDTNLPFEYSQSLDWNDLFAGDPSFDTDVSMAFDRLNISTALGQEYFNKFNFAVELDNFEIDITAYFDNQKTPHIRFTFSYQEEVEVTPYFSDVLSGEIILDISYPLGHEHHFEMVNLVNTLLDRQIDTFESLAVKLAMDAGYTLVAVIATVVAVSLLIYLGIYASPMIWKVLQNLLVNAGMSIFTVST